MPRKKAAQFRCRKCGESFKMAMHLGRHMSTRHAGATKKRRARRPAKRRPRSIAPRFDVETMPADELAALLRAVQEEVKRRLAGLRRATR